MSKKVDPIRIELIEKFQNMENQEVTFLDSICITHHVVELKKIQRISKIKIRTTTTTHNTN